MLHNKLYWFLIIILSIPLFLYLGINIASTQILLTEPALTIASVFIKILGITDEGVVLIAKNTKLWFLIYSIFLIVLSSIFSVLVTISEKDDNKRPWKYPFVVIVEIILVILMILGINYYKKASYKSAVRSNIVSNNLITNIKGTNVSDLAYSRNILRINFDLIRLNASYKKLIMEMNIRDKQGEIIGYTAIKIYKDQNRWRYKDLLFDRELKIINGKVQQETVLYEDKNVLARIISVTVKDSSPTSPTLNKIILAKDVVIMYEKNPFVVGVN